MRHLSEAERNDLLDGVLEGAARREAERHLAGCPACRARTEELRGLVGRVTGLPRSLPPDPALRERLRARLEEREDEGARPETFGIAPAAHEGTPRSGVRWRPLAAAAVVVLLLGALATYRLVSGGGASPESGDSASALVDARAGSGAEEGLDELRDAEARYRSAISELEGVLRRRGSRLSPETRELLDRNLRVIDRAIEESNRALEADPGSPVLNRVVVSAYRQKLELLKLARETSEG